MAIEGPGPSPNPSSLLVALDDTAASQNVLQWAIDNVWRPGDTVYLLHVIPQPIPDVVIGAGGGLDSVVTVPPDEEEDKKHAADAQELMARRFLPILERHKVPSKVDIVRFLTDENSIGAAICKRAEALNPRAVIMGKHNRGAIATLLMGSAAAYASVHCKPPLIVVHDPEQGSVPSVPVLGGTDGNANLDHEA